ncbi:uncharacterized protein EV422DRAFT_7602 [Fimicolochytrium jonesii]|uniref:uncharacterized protein n=1 Tax=Fimicolochytrium jonesii TaxID=1396493 RepID=UPI0022FF1AD9|nr:uncharacterized protein EV422DRAFT_7602 [Fimicolochytrium jonesii]KAI8826717.1 hypothetical protein EV422DRAFT_7602 [Fimicolochytrium jonesii]
MLAQHKQQIRQLEEKYREEVVKEKSILVEQQQRQMEGMRDRIVAERQRACEEEREFSRQRYQKQLERDELEFQQQKRKLLAEFDEQKHAISESAKQERQNEELVHRKQLEEIRRQLDAEREAKAHALEDLRRRQNAESTTLREKLAIEREEWQAQYMAKQEAEMRTREKQFKEKLIRERDSEIEMVVQRLESETSSNSSEGVRRHRLEIERIRSEVADEIKQLRDQHSLALDKVVSAQNEKRLAEETLKGFEKKLLQLQYESTAKDNLIRDQKTELTRLKVDEQTLMEAIRKDFVDQIDAKEEALTHCKDQLAQHDQEMEATRHLHNQRLEELRQEKQEHTIQMIEEQVRKAMGAKDQVIGSLKAEAQDLGIKNKYLEQIIEKQRQELLT